MDDPTIIPPRPLLPGLELLEGAIDGHIHCAPHINQRTVTVFDAMRMAAAAGMRAVGIMDVFANTSGLAALANRELGHLGVEAFGGIILEPYAGGVSAHSVRAALKMGYNGGGARFVSLPCHHTRFVARAEGRSPAYVEACLAIAETEPLPDEICAIIDLCVEAGAVFNTGHLAGPEHLRLVEEARRRGAERILVPASYLALDEATAIAALGAKLEFSFFVLGHATQVPQTMIDQERHRFAMVELASVVEIIRRVGPDAVVLSSDSGAVVLPPPVEAMREFLMMLRGSGFGDDALRTMTSRTPAGLFGIG